MQIKNEGSPNGGLMFRYGGDYRNMVLCICGIKHGIETTIHGALKLKINIPINIVIAIIAICQKFLKLLVVKRDLVH